MLGLTGMFLKRDYKWLASHGELVKGKICCMETGTPIYSRALHYVRSLDDHASCKPFRRDMLPGNGEMISFSQLWCVACESDRSEPEMITSNDLVTPRKRKAADP